MSIVKINAITVPEGKGAELEKRFAARQHAVDNAPGFEGFELLRPVKGDDRYFVVTRWTDESSFEAWRDSDPHTRKPSSSSENHTQSTAHTGGRTPVATGADLLEFEVVLSSHPEK
ncbi:antibiotic biosynthesis monooxygenase family protein [Corynebacterium anserum]|uniref:Antibiotic biosynthesis monooxygenase n=1 Tax=Corynebacterium anserum TaxID=2684406 RepID=A0A7G7YN92_9CORY|nr:antibiotic biosynthesis monooxygenase [Corynebacterium anserum]MBC2681509.1 antibiotic biosynthesis monooxygenase [Corynebacterium anserum]QNH95962.1 antibiotic biosynthesis monooxygenase [Corynebacterium anserum]